MSKNHDTKVVRSINSVNAKTKTDLIKNGAAMLGDPNAPFIAKAVGLAKRADSSPDQTRRNIQDARVLAVQSAYSVLNPKAKVNYGNASEFAKGAVSGERHAYSFTIHAEGGAVVVMLRTGHGNAKDDAGEIIKYAGSQACSVYRTEGYGLHSPVRFIAKVDYATGATEAASAKGDNLGEAIATDATKTAYAIAEAVKVALGADATGHPENAKVISALVMRDARI